MTQILGLTCISEELKEKNKKKYSFRTMTRRGFNTILDKQATSVTESTVSFY